MSQQSQDIHKGKSYKKQNKAIERSVRLYTVNLHTPINKQCKTAIQVLLKQQIAEDPSQEACTQADQWQEKRWLKKKEKSKSKITTF